MKKNKNKESIKVHVHLLFCTGTLLKNAVYMIKVIRNISTVLYFEVL